MMYDVIVIRSKIESNAMKPFFLGGVALAALAIAGVANAADIAVRSPVYQAPPMAPVSSWTGFYIGANGGGAWGRDCWTFIGTLPDVGLPGPGHEGCHDPSGGIVGGQVGFNWQSGPLVFGLEAQGNWASLRDQNVSLLPSPPFPASTNRTHVDGLGLFTGRLGYAWGSVLLYAKGGAAVVRDKYDFFLNSAPGAPAFANQTRWGGTGGGGIEYKFSQNWSGAIEYDFVGLGTSRVTFPPLPVSAIVDVRHDLHLVTARINYSFR
jgi:outer membrane immunogenic protein